jgi:hypothetical protein
VANVNLHGASPWHPRVSSGKGVGSGKRETPLDKPVASLMFFVEGEVCSDALVKMKR